MSIFGDQKCQNSLPQYTVCSENQKIIFGDFSTKETHNRSFQIILRAIFTSTPNKQNQKSWFIKENKHPLHLVYCNWSRIVYWLFNIEWNYFCTAFVAVCSMHLAAWFCQMLSMPGRLNLETIKRDRTQYLLNWTFTLFLNRQNK